MPCICTTLAGRLRSRFWISWAGVPAAPVPSGLVPARRVFTAAHSCCSWSQMGVPRRRVATFSPRSCTNWGQVLDRTAPGSNAGACSAAAASAATAWGSSPRASSSASRAASCSRRWASAARSSCCTGFRPVVLSITSSSARRVAAVVLSMDSGVPSGCCTRCCSACCSVCAGAGAGAGAAAAPSLWPASAVVATSVTVLPSASL